MNDGNPHGNVAKTFPVGLKVCRWMYRRTAGKAGNVRKAEKGIDAVEIEPSENKPEGQRESGWAAQDEELQVCITNGGLAVGESAEQAAEIVDACGHDAYGLEDLGGVRCGSRELDFKRAESAGCE